MIYRIRSTERPHLFWSSRQGWVGSDDARTFTAEEREQIDLPWESSAKLGRGEWVEDTTAKSVLVHILEAVEKFSLARCDTMRQVQEQADTTIKRISDLVHHGMSKCLAPDHVRVVVEVVGGSVSDEHGNADVLICDWDNIKAGDGFVLPDDWIVDPSLQEFVEGPYREVRDQKDGDEDGRG